jgi:hypothetical protein
MGKKGKSKYDGSIEKNQKFNKWMVVDNKIFLEKEAKVLCRCTECNITEKHVPILHLINGLSKSCTKCGFSRKQSENPAWKGYKEIPFAWFSNYFIRKGKKRTGSITIEDIYNLWIKQNKKCSLSGVEINFTKNDIEGITASIDRIDSKKEYDLDNIQLVHKDVNLMKNKFNEEYFINMCKKIVENNEKRLDTTTLYKRNG